MSSGHAAAAATDRLRGPFSGRSPAAKLVVLVVFLLVVGATPNTELVALAAWGFVAAATAALAYVEWGAVVRRLVLDLPLAVLALAQALLGRAPTVAFGPLTLSQPGLTVGVAMLAKATIGVVAVSALAACTSVPEVLAGLRRLRLPAWFVDLVGLTFRQVAVLRDDLERMRLAATLRHPARGRRAVWAVAGRSLGTLLVRATERADRLALAADLRNPAAARPREDRATEPAAAPTPAGRR